MTALPQASQQERGRRRRAPGTKGEGANGTRGGSRQGRRHHSGEAGRRGHSPAAPPAGPDFDPTAAPVSMMSGPPPVMPQRRALENVRVVQRNLVYVIGLPVTLAREEVCVCVGVVPSLFSLSTRAALPPDIAAARVFRPVRACGQGGGEPCGQQESRHGLHHV